MSAPARPRPECLRDEKWLIEQVRRAIATREAADDKYDPARIVEHAARMQWYAEQLADALEKHHE